MKKENEKYNKELRNNSVKLEDCLVTINGIVEYINGFTYQTSFTPTSEIRIGGSSPSYNGGNRLRTEMIIKDTLILSNDGSYDGEVKKLIFDGAILPIYVGDEISADLYACEKKSELDNYRFGYNNKSHYLKRDLKEEENVICIRKLKGDVVLASYMVT